MAQILQTAFVKGCYEFEENKLMDKFLFTQFSFPFSRYLEITIRVAYLHNSKKRFYVK
jgi:hypothetical protein